MAKAKDEVRQETAEKHNRWETQGWHHGNRGPRAGAATPGEEGTEARLEAVTRSDWETHCDHVYGGAIWLKFLITLGDIPRHAIDVLHDLYEARTLDKRGQRPGETPDATPAGDYLRRRADRASTPVPVPANWADYRFGRVRSWHRKLRQSAKDRLDTLMDMQESGLEVAQETMAAAMRMMEEAEEDLQDSLLGNWVNVWNSTEAVAFEMVLEITLRELYGCDEWQVDTITRDRKLPWRGNEGGSVSRHAQAPQAQAGTGPGSSGGSGGRGGRGGTGQPRQGGGYGRDGNVVWATLPWV